METRWLKLKSLHQQILSGSPLNMEQDESKQLTKVIKVLLDLEVGSCEKFPSRCLHCHQLLALTLLKMMFENPGKNRNKNYDSQLFTELEPVLLKKLFCKDGFISYSTHKLLMIILKSESLMEEVKTRILDALCEKMKLLKSSTETEIILQLLSQILSRQNGERVNILAFKILKKHLPGIFTAIAQNLKCNSLALNFYTLLVKMTKFINQQPNCVELLKEIYSHYISKLVEVLKGNLQSSDKNITTRKLLDFFNTLLCYSDKLVLQKQVDDFYIDFGTRLLNEICDSETCFELKTNHEGFMGDIIDQPVTDFPSTRRMVLVIFKAFVVVVKSNCCNAELKSKIKDCLNIMNRNLFSDYDPTVTSLKWLSVIFEDQDDAYIECLLCLLDIYTQNRDSELSPYPVYFQFLETTDYDTSVIMDWLVSPETCFLLYLSRFLKVVILEWTLFVKTAHTRYPEKCGKDLNMTEELLVVDNHDDKNPSTTAEGNATMDTSSASMLEGKGSLSENMQRSISDSSPEKEVASLNRDMKCDEGLDSKGHVNETMSEYDCEKSVQDKISLLSQGMSAIMAYSDSDSEESEIDALIRSDQNINNSNKHLQSEDSIISCDNSKPESIQSETSVISCDMKCLDSVMSLLIHVRIQIERLVNQDLFPYNPAHLLSLISHCEDLYEI